MSTKSQARLSRPDFSHEDARGDAVCGIDEAGRGPLAGPVMAACVYIPAGKRKLSFWSEVTDSKKMTEKQRSALAPQIRDHCFFGVAMASVGEIDTLNIHHATLLAMRRAFEMMSGNFKFSPCHALVDGKFTPDLSCPATAIVEGDFLSLSIAAASVLAKVERDLLMRSLHTEHPQYQWITNAGYGTAAHLEAIKIHGPSPHHRRSFAPLRQQSLF